MISHEHRAVFVHIPKSAGQSVEQAFLNDLGLGWDDRDPLLLRTNKNSRIGPPRLAHLTATDYVRHYWLSQRLFDEYFTFTFVRDPRDRVFSMYRYLTTNGFFGCEPGQAFSDFVRHDLAGRLWRERHWFTRPQADYIYDEDNNQLVEFIGRFDHLSDDFATVAKRVDLRESSLPRRNVTTKSSGAGYEDSVDDRAHGVFCDLYARDLALLGYPAETEDLAR